MRLLTEIISEAATSQSEHQAFRCGGDAMTYGQLYRKALEVSACLNDHGVRAGDRVGISLSRRIESPVAVFGALFAGAAYVPIDPSAPFAVKQAIIKDCGIRHMISDSPTSIGGAERSNQQFDLEFQLSLTPGVESSSRSLPWSALSAYASDSDPRIDLSDESMAYIIYTSGSTGCPKGIVHTHRSALSYARLAAETYSLCHTDVIASHAPLHFDMSTFGYFAGPFSGATTMLITQPQLLMPASLAHAIASERVTVWYSVPFALCQLLQSNTLNAPELDSLRWVIYAGETFPERSLKRLMQSLPSARFSNVYGPTETNHCTHFHLPKNPTREDWPVPIGKPWLEADYRIVDDADNMIINGGVGELLIASPTTMKGYWNQPEQNAQAFFQSDATDAPSFYRTGDLVRRRSDGNLLFLGRKDRQIKVRGHRVELDAIERVLMSHSDVQEAVVIANDEIDNATKLEATCVLSKDASASTEDIRRYAVSQLPAYCVPESLKVVQRLQRTTTGKLNRNALVADKGK